jgi:TPP-dependent pyruvate/acetoin dehydrogenase alpha subunit
MVGIALAARMKGQPSVAMTYIGEGASATGDFHEIVNMAAVLDLPFVRIIENNRYAYSTPASRAAAVPDSAMRAKCYGIPSEMVDGNDVLAIYRATRIAIHRARAGDGPTIIEVKTMRMHGHSDADSPWYAPKEELENGDSERFPKPLVTKKKLLTVPEFVPEFEIPQAWSRHPFPMSPPGNVRNARGYPVENARSGTVS